MSTLTFAVFLAVNGVLLSLGALLAGGAGNAFGVRPTLWIGISIGLLAPLLLLPLRHLRRMRALSGRAADEM